MTVYLAAVIGVGLFISSLAKTQQQGILGAFVFMVPAILLSGFATPIENMPDWLQTLTLANPMRYYMVIVKGVFLKGMPAAMVLQLLWPLAVIAMVTLSAATWLFRHRSVGPVWHSRLIVLEQLPQRQDETGQHVAAVE